MTRTPMPTVTPTEDVNVRERFWKLPPPTPVDGKRKGPRLVNYAHRQDILESSGVSDIEERLAQWDVVILNPDHHLSLDKIRNTNPNTKILMWIPLQGPGPYMSLYKGFQSTWNAKTTDGKTLMAPWNIPIANLYADNYGYVFHILDYLGNHYQPYDGVFYDCMWEDPFPGADLNEDGVLNSKDREALQSATLTLLKETRQRFPRLIVVGNGGVPWSEACPYYQYANGNMRENAMGSEFGDPSWDYTWKMYNVVAGKSQKPSYYFINVDVRAYDRTQSQAQALNSLTQDDLRRMRVGLVGSMLLDSGYFGFDRGDVLHGQLWWLDEYDINMGDALGLYSESLYGPGTLSREFGNGFAILNNSDKPIQATFKTNFLDVSFRQEGTSFVIPTKDARILLRR